jgi:hypothetical protein
MSCDNTGRAGEAGHAQSAAYFATEERIFAKHGYWTNEVCKGEYMQQNFPADRFSEVCHPHVELRELLVQACNALDDCPEKGFQYYAETFYIRLQAANRQFASSQLQLVEGDDFLIYGDQVVLKNPLKNVSDAVVASFLKSFAEIVGPEAIPKIESIRVSLAQGVSFEQKTDFFSKYGRLFNLF